MENLKISSGQDHGPEEFKESQESDPMAPQLPPEMVNGFKVENKEDSELKSSIKKKGGNSYYYAHNYEG